MLKSRVPRPCLPISRIPRSVACCFGAPGSRSVSWNDNLGRPATACPDVRLGLGGVRRRFGMLLNIRYLQKNFQSINSRYFVQKPSPKVFNPHGLTVICLTIKPLKPPPERLRDPNRPRIHTPSPSQPPHPLRLLEMMTAIPAPLPRNPATPRSIVPDVDTKLGNSHRYFLNNLNPAVPSDDPCESKARYNRRLTALASQRYRLVNGGICDDYNLLGITKVHVPKCYSWHGYLASFET